MGDNAILDGPLAQDGYEPSGDFKKLNDAVQAGLVPDEQIDAAANVMREEIAKAQSSAQIVSIVTGVLGGLMKAVKF